MFWNGIVLGLGAAIPIGPVNVEIARRTLGGGPLAGFALGCGAVTIDVIFAVIVSLGVARLTDSPWISWPLTVTGIIVLLYLAFLSLLSAWRAYSAKKANIVPDSLSAERPTPLNGYLAGLAMTGLNPYTWAFWLGGVSGSAKTLTEHPEHDLPIICLGVFLATLSWVICFTGTMSVLRRFGGKSWLIIADAVGGVVLLAFAGTAAWAAVGKWV